MNETGPKQEPGQEQQQASEQQPESISVSAEPKPETEFSPETKKLEDTEEQIERLKGEIKEAIDIDKEQSPKIEEENSEVRKEKIEKYQKRYLPKYLRKRGGIISRAMTYLYTRNVEFEREGEENLPEKGPFLVICNHFGGGDSEALLKTFKDFDLHLGVAKKIWWNSSVLTRWFLKRIRTIPIEESLSNISEEEKEAALKRQGEEGQVVFRKIIDREKQGRKATNVEFTRQAIATLLRGDALGIYPEGLWLNPEYPLNTREKAEMKQGYRGIELVARQYQKLTGENLSIIPTAFIEDKTSGKKKLVIGKSLKLSENDGNLNGTDWCMKHVAEMLPEEQRGYYKEVVEK